MLEEPSSIGADHSNGSANSLVLQLGDDYVDPTQTTMTQEKGLKNNHTLEKYRQGFNSLNLLNKPCDSPASNASTISSPSFEIHEPYFKQIEDQLEKSICIPVSPIVDVVDECDDRLTPVSLILRASPPSSSLSYPSAKSGVSDISQYASDSDNMRMRFECITELEKESEETALPGLQFMAAAVEELSNLPLLYSWDKSKTAKKKEAKTFNKLIKKKTKLQESLNELLDLQTPNASTAPTSGSILSTFSWSHGDDISYVRASDESRKSAPVEKESPKLNQENEFMADMLCSKCNPPPDIHQQEMDKLIETFPPSAHVIMPYFPLTGDPTIDEIYCYPIGIYEDESNEGSPLATCDKVVPSAPDAAEELSKDMVMNEVSLSHLPIEEDPTLLGQAVTLETSENEMADLALVTSDETINKVEERTILAQDLQVSEEELSYSPIEDSGSSEDEKVKSSDDTVKALEQGSEPPASSEDVADNLQVAGDKESSLEMMVTSDETDNSLGHSGEPKVYVSDDEEGWYSPIVEDDECDNFAPGDGEHPLPEAIDKESNLEMMMFSGETQTTLAQIGEHNLQEAGGLELNSEVKVISGETENFLEQKEMEEKVPDYCKKDEEQNLHQTRDEESIMVVVGTSEKKENSLDQRGERMPYDMSDEEAAYSLLVEDNLSGYSPSKDEKQNLQETGGKESSLEAMRTSHETEKLVRQGSEVTPYEYMSEEEALHSLLTQLKVADEFALKNAEHNLQEATEQKKDERAPYANMTDEEILYSLLAEDKVSEKFIQPNLEGVRDEKSSAVITSDETENLIGQGDEPTPSINLSDEKAAYSSNDAEYKEDGDMESNAAIITTSDKTERLPEQKKDEPTQAAYCSLVEDKLLANSASRDAVHNLQEADEKESDLEVMETSGETGNALEQERGEFVPYNSKSDKCVNLAVYSPMMEDTVFDNTASIDAEHSLQETNVKDPNLEVMETCDEIESSLDQQRDDSKPDIYMSDEEGVYSPVVEDKISDNSTLEAAEHILQEAGAMELNLEVEGAIDEMENSSKQNTVEHMPLIQMSDKDTEYSSVVEDRLSDNSALEATEHSLQEAGAMELNLEVEGTIDEMENSSKQKTVENMPFIHMSDKETAYSSVVEDKVSDNSALEAAKHHVQEAEAIDSNVESRVTMDEMDISSEQKSDDPIPCIQMSNEESEYSPVVEDKIPDNSELKAAEQHVQEAVPMDYNFPESENKILNLQTYEDESNQNERVLNLLDPKKLVLSDKVPNFLVPYNDKPNLQTRETTASYKTLLEPKETLISEEELLPVIKLPLERKECIESVCDSPLIAGLNELVSKSPTAQDEISLDVTSSREIKEYNEPASHLSLEEREEFTLKTTAIKDLSDTTLMVDMMKKSPSVEGVLESSDNIKESDEYVSHLSMEGGDVSVGKTSEGEELKLKTMATEDLSLVSGYVESSNNRKERDRVLSFPSLQNDDASHFVPLECQLLNLLKDTEKNSDTPLVVVDEMVSNSSLQHDKLLGLSISEEGREEEKEAEREEEEDDDDVSSATDYEKDLSNCPETEKEVLHLPQLQDNVLEYIDDGLMMDWTNSGNHTLVISEEIDKIPDLLAAGENVTPTISVADFASSHLQPTTPAMVISSLPHAESSIDIQEGRLYNNSSLVKYSRPNSVGESAARAVCSNEIQPTSSAPDNRIVPATMTSNQLEREQTLQEFEISQLIASGYNFVIDPTLISDISNSPFVFFQENGANLTEVAPNGISPPLSEDRLTISPVPESESSDSSRSVEDFPDSPLSGNKLLNRVKQELVGHPELHVSEPYRLPPFASLVPYLSRSPSPEIVSGPVQRASNVEPNISKLRTSFDNDFKFSITKRNPVVVDPCPSVSNNITTSADSKWGVFSNNRTASVDSKWDVFSSSVGSRSSIATATNTRLIDKLTDSVEPPSKRKHLLKTANASTQTKTRTLTRESISQTQILSDHITKLMRGHQELLDSMTIITQVKEEEISESREDQGQGRISDEFFDRIDLSWQLEYEKEKRKAVEAQFQADEAERKAAEAERIAAEADRKALEALRQAEESKRLAQAADDQQRQRRALLNIAKLDRARRAGIAEKRMINNFVEAMLPECTTSTQKQNLSRKREKARKPQLRPNKQLKFELNSVVDLTFDSDDDELM